jgi:DNA adenine methylase
MRKIDSTGSAGRAGSVRARPLAGYIGGKWRLRSTICPLIDRDDHRCYVEPFLGMGSVFLGRERRPPVEVVNDKSDQVITLFRVVQRHPDALVRAVRHQLTSRAEYGRLFKVDPSTLTDVERAARFLVLRRMTFGSKDPHLAGFGIGIVNAKLFNAAEVLRRIEILHARLDHVVIEHLDFERLLRTYDSPRSFFYLDPPYWGATHAYREAGFTQADFPRLAAALERLKGRWLLSLNDRPEVRALFRFATVRRIAAHRSVQGGGVHATTELLISSP